MEWNIHSCRMLYMWIKQSANHFDSLVGVFSLDDFLVWRLETLATPTVNGIVMYLSGHQQCCIPNYTCLNYLTYTGKFLASSSSSGAPWHSTRFKPEIPILKDMMLPHLKDVIGRTATSIEYILKAEQE